MLRALSGMLQIRKIFDYDVSDIMEINKDGK